MVTLAQFLASPIRYFRIALEQGLTVITPFGVAEIRRKDNDEEARGKE